MEPKKLAALISSLISDLLLLLLLLFPSSTSLSVSPISPNSNSYGNIFPLLRHFLSTQELAAASLSLLTFSRKRKRSHYPQLDSDPTHEDRHKQHEHRLSELDRVVQNPDSFKLVFKMRSSTFEWLAGLLEPLLDCRDPIGSPLNLSAELRLDCARFKLAQLDSISNNAVSVQIVVDSSSRILSIAAGFRGENGGSRILKSTTLYKDISRGRLLNNLGENQYLIGGKKYPLLPWLMVPFSDANSGSIEEKFNEKNELIRVCAHRTISSLKNWGVLKKPIEEDMKSGVAFIAACSILHNGLLMREDDSALMDLGDFDEEDDDGGDGEIEGKLIESKGSEIRYELARRLIEFQ
ncbi:protein ANTAGONIST OF LIKE HETEROCHROMATIN PROTEIN 1-like isoform X2 [Euphorbia lathyris]|uniref:protein ANTAGONIST OF LIKE HETEROCHROMATIN PROTEIN 1-like isoform X2 n=1 Tax=Euphorbia lathyris TaxID=212925 RepID=UPI0033138E4C